MTKGFCICISLYLHPREYVYHISWELQVNDAFITYRNALQAPSKKKNPHASWGTKSTMRLKTMLGKLVQYVRTKKSHDACLSRTLRYSGSSQALIEVWREHDAVQSLISALMKQTPVYFWLWYHVFERKHLHLKKAVLMRMT